MNISGYGVAYNNNSYGALSSKAKVPYSAIAILDKKAEPENKNNVSLPKNNVGLSSAVYTKTEPVRSDAEILEDMAELAKKHAEQGTFQEEDADFQKLMKEYVSPVSPNREEILKNTMNEINENIKMSHSKKKKEKEEDFSHIGKLLQMLKNMEKKKDKISSGDETMDNRGDKSNGQIAYNMEGANYLACVENGEVEAAMIRDSNGETVMCIDSNASGQSSVVQCWTIEEGRRSAELLETYNETYRNISSSKGFTSGNMFNGVG
jgi:hypothetical protein